MNNDHLAENRRKQHQDKLHDELNREAKERLLENKVNHLNLTLIKSFI